MVDGPEMAPTGSTSTPACLWDARALLGEGPIWDEETERLYWVDIDAPAIHCCDHKGNNRRSYPMPCEVGCIALRRSGGLVAGLKTGLALVDLPLASPEGSVCITPILDPEPDRPGNRFNDGKCDAAGRFWAGTMDQAIQAPSGVIYRLDPDLSVHEMDAGYVVTNGQAFSPDGQTFYHNDSMAGVIHAFDCDPATGEICNKREFLRLPEDAGLPDGMTVDARGDLWLAHWGGWRVSRIDAQGTVQQVISLPVAQVTSCAFGGPDLDILFITSARTGLSVDAMADQPLAGGLFALQVDATGRPPDRFGG